MPSYVVDAFLPLILSRMCDHSEVTKPDAPTTTPTKSTTVEEALEHAKHAFAIFDPESSLEVDCYISCTKTHYTGYVQGIKVCFEILILV